MSDEVATNSTVTEEGLECDPNVEDCYLPRASQFAAAHFFNWFLCWINAATLIIYWFVWFKPEQDANTAATTILNTNFWWMQLAWPMTVYGHAGLYGVPTFFGIFTWFGVKFFDEIYRFWMHYIVTYLGTLMHWFAIIGFLAGAAFWVE